ncbi:hypothetical protein SLEP1_g43302 [Rubroshorea leprosula]|uniref:GIR1-like zinc ribbon domain-containing protein n=1 Tax=Rubroshorea leprosula TaxID=152421 RepID=A0AAV5LDL2_9ROSI|nr:hypothetical protein SLEP1_g43302 [Rubroshorea leprosula]
MSRRAGNPRLELNVESSPPRANPIVESPDTSISSEVISPESSCVSSEQEEVRMQYPDSREATSMVLVGCHRCLMYVISSNVDPKCPRCHNTVLLGDLLNEESPMRARN